MTISSTTLNFLDKVEEIRPLIHEHAANAEANRQLSDTVYDAMYEAGLFAMLAPKTYGGLELHPIEAMRVWESVAVTDSAAAWNLVMNQAIACFAAWLPATGVQELFSDGPPTIAGALNPPAAAAVQEAVQRCKVKTPAYSVTPLREQQLAQFQIANAKARVETSRDTLYRAAEAAYEDVERPLCLGGSVDVRPGK